MVSPSLLVPKTGRHGSYLTKSLFLQAVSCPRKLQYGLHPRSWPTTSTNNTNSNSLRQQLAADGQKVGVYARLLYPDGILIQGGGTHTDTTTLEALVDQTSSLLGSASNKKESVTLFEAAIQHGQCLIRADILHASSQPQKTSHNNDTNNTTMQQQPQQLQLLEVKAKSWDSRKGRDEQLLGKRGGIQSEWLPYIQDVAFQTWVLQRAFPHCTIIKSSLVLPDQAKRNTSVNGLYGLLETDPHGQIYLPEPARQQILQHDELLLEVVPVDDLVEQVLDSPLVFPGSTTTTGEEFFRTVVEQWEEIVLQEAVAVDHETTPLDRPPPVIGKHCRDCDYRVSVASDHHDNNNNNNNNHQPILVSGFSHCWKEATGLDLDTKDGMADTHSPLVIDLYYGGTTVTKLMAQKKYQFQDVTPQDLGLNPEGVDPKNVGKPGMSRRERQWHQVVHNDNGIPITMDDDENSNSSLRKVILDEDYLRDAMASWQYPYHFVDFETLLPALPYTLHKHPFQALAFQFSHHLLHADGRVEHASEFLHTEPGVCPNRPFLDALEASLGGDKDNNGTVFRWGSHENTILAALLKSEHYESSLLASLLTPGDRAMVDLMTVLTKGYYVAGSGASSSIKQVLLPTLATSETLQELYRTPSYSGQNFTKFQWWVPDDHGMPRDPYQLLAFDPADDAAGVVAHGGDAMRAYHTLQQTHLLPEQRAALRSSLLRYCELDTLAMVMITQALQGMLLAEEKT